ncbi:hypothetical protein [Citreimonas sp.]|uniref:hypothetical protein n=1 Tax=Citreimonas sp. TaxID=3036715 RepID=UPI00405992AF
MTVYLQGLNTRIKALIKSPKIGCYATAAEIINTTREEGRPGISEGTISKRLRGNLEWPTTEWMALEDVAGSYPVSRYIATRRNEDTGDEAVVFTHLDTMREGTEASLAQAEAEGSEDPEAIIKAIEETDDVLRLAEAQKEALQSRLRSLNVTPLGRKPGAA